MTKRPYKILAKNRRAKFDYDINDQVIAGLVLSGPEAKSVRAGAVSLKGAFANFKSGELWVNNLHISKYPQAVYSSSYEPTQPRKLLLNKSELSRLLAGKQNGKHIVVVSIGLSGKYIKLELGTGNSKRKYDKRQQIKSADQRRDADKTVFGRNKS